MRKFAISDIHGCNRSFNTLLKKIKFTKGDQLYLLGDYIDRGPDSMGVIDTILDLIQKGFQIKCLRGNHEEQMVISKNSAEGFHSWKSRWGGMQTLESFGTNDLGKIEEKYWKFLDTLEYFFLVDDYILVHAGLNFEVENPLEETQSMMWMREWYHEIRYEWLKERIIIHGHTPFETAEIQRAYHQLKEVQVMNIDNGCFNTYGEGKGKLCAFDMTNKLLYFQENIDDMTAYFA